MRHMKRETINNALHTMSTKKKEAIFWTVHFEIEIQKQVDRIFQKKKNRVINWSEVARKTPTWSKCVQIYFLFCQRKKEKSVENEKTNKTINVCWKSNRKTTTKCKRKRTREKSEIVICARVCEHMSNVSEDCV